MKTPVVLLPALLCTTELFSFQTKALKDLCDFHLPEAGTDTSVQSAARRILKEAPERFVLGGISMGGYVAFEILRQAPERVAGLILMDTNAKADAPQSREKRKAMIEKARTQGIRSVISPALLDIIAPANRTDKMRTFLSRMAMTMGIEKYVNEQTLIMERPDSTALLSEIKCPVLVMGGESDALSSPEDMENLALKIPNAVHVVIKDSGHLPPLENPEAVTDIWRSFLEKITF